jgi:hypothetical protein
LAVKNSSSGYFIATEVLANLLEAQLSICLCFEERCRCGGKVGMLGGLIRVAMMSAEL